MENRRQNKEKVTKAIYGAVDDVNKLLPRQSRLVKSPDSVIIGRSGKLDSLGLVNMIVAVESKIRAEFGISINLAEAGVMSQDKGPLRTIGTLANYVTARLEENLNGR